MSIRIAVLLSGRHGRGSNMEAIARACADGRIDGQVVRVVGNFADSPALERARALGLETLALPSPPRGASEDREAAYAEALEAALLEAAPDLICLAGYMRRVPPPVLRAYPGRILNIHAALLPAFGGRGMYGIRIHEAALEYGVKVSGCTVHFVDENYDTGPVVLQIPVPVEEGDTPETLAARVLKAEHEAFPRAAALFAAGRIQLDGRRVRIRP